MRYYKTVENRNKILNSSLNVQEPPAPQSFYERNKLRIAGALNGFGDVALLLDGYTKEKDDSGKEIDKSWLKATGWLYTLGAAVITFFGKVDKEQEIKELSKRTAEFLQNNADNKSADLQSTQIAQAEVGALTKAKRSLQRHAGQVMLAFYTAGAATLFVSGIKSYKNPPAGGTKKPIGDVLVGGMSLLIKTTSMLLPEKVKSIDNTQAEDKQGGVIGWIKEKPMRLFGYGSMLTEAFWGYRAYEKKQQGKNWKLSAATGAAYAASDVVIATANKDSANAAGKMNQTEQENLEEMVAETIAHQSVEQQEALAAKTASFLETQGAVNGNADELRQSIMQRVEKRSDKQWATRAEEMPVAEHQLS